MKFNALRNGLLVWAGLSVLILTEGFLNSVTLGADAPISQSDANPELGEATPIRGALESLGVFKNGVVVVKERYHVSSAGSFCVMVPPSPLHGTFFIQSDVPIETRSREERVDVPLIEEKIDWTTDFSGRWLSIVLPGETEARVVRVIQQSDALNNNLSRGSVADFSPYDRFARISSISPNTPSLNSNKSVLLQCESGETIWLADASSVSSVVLKEGIPATVSRVKPVIIFDVKEVDPAKGTTFYLSYLTREASWAPQYNVLLKDEKTLEIEQSAILINDWKDFSAESTFLYSGFPQIVLKNSLSPMSPGVDLGQFFNSLNQASRNGQDRDPAYMTQMMLNNAVSPRDSLSDVGLPALDEESSGSVGVDIFTQPIGAKTLKKGERALFTIDKQSTTYRRIIRWDIFDARDSNGRLNSPQNPNSYGRTTTGQTDDSSFMEPWDVVVFRNPFSFPITTGPASIYSTDNFLGQNSLYWRNPGEKTFLPVTKALGIRVNSSENERVFAPSTVGQELAFEHNYTPSLHSEAWGNIVRINNVRYRCVVIDTAIELDNQRNETVEIEICRRVTGIPIAESFEGFDAAPEITRRSDWRPYYDWYYHVNPFSEASWTTTLKPKERRTLKFSYQVLILL